MDDREKEEKSYPHYSFPGGYPLYYITKDGGVICPDCATEHFDQCTDPEDPEWFIINHNANYEDENLYCDHCGRHIKPAYGGYEE